MLSHWKIGISLAYSFNYRLKISLSARLSNLLVVEAGDVVVATVEVVGGGVVLSDKNNTYLMSETSITLVKAAVS